jgi:hypothetical protein
MINEGNFRGYNKLLKQAKIRNSEIPQLYAEKEYERIIDYIKEEAEIFINAYQKLRVNMPLLKEHL